MQPITTSRNANIHLVSELIDHTPASWREDMVRGIFLPMDADVILGIPLGIRQMSDFWSWVFEKRGEFTVRSAYRMLAQTKHEREGWLYHSANSRTINQKQRIGPACGELQCRLRSGSFYGGWHNTLCQLMTRSSCATWQHIHIFLYVGTQTHGFTRFSSVLWLDAYGHFQRRMLWNIR